MVLTRITVVQTIHDHTHAYPKRSTLSSDVRPLGNISPSREMKRQGLCHTVCVIPWL